VFVLLVANAKHWSRLSPGEASVQHKHKHKHIQTQTQIGSGAASVDNENALVGKEAVLAERGDGTSTPISTGTNTGTNTGNNSERRDVKKGEIDNRNDIDIDSNSNMNSNNNNNNNKDIREWGCDRTETPLIFVHNGKMGGGNVRVRLAASAMEFTRLNKEWRHPQLDNHYYPVRDGNGNDGSNSNSNNNNDNSVRRGKFCNSKYPNYNKIGDQDTHQKPTMEGRVKCNATTPFGIAIACPHPYKISTTRLKSHKIELFKKHDKRVARASKKRLEYLRRELDAHYKSTDCQRCDDDYYLDVDYYFDTINNTINDTSSTTAPPKVPLPTDRNVFDPASDPHPGHTCDVVLTAHNNIGGELNWLPPRYLKEHWWDNSVFGRTNNNDNDDDNDNSAMDGELDRYWATLLDDRKRRRLQLSRTFNKEHADDGQEEDSTATATTSTSTSTRWCPDGYSAGKGTKKYDRPATKAEYNNAFQTCGMPLAEKADKIFMERFYPSSSGNNNDKGKGKGVNHSPFYASMPLHRVTMLRDPWSWIVSKFFWHNLDGRHRQIQTETKPDGQGSSSSSATSTSLSCEDVLFSTSYKRTYPNTDQPMGWCEDYSLSSLMKLCGNDCYIRYENGMMSLDEIEDQVESNLRNAFSVVGLLNETESFYDMITDRIDYVNLTYNTELTGKDHATKKSEENLACKKLYQTDEAFRETVRQNVPAFAILERIDRVGIEVNRFQQQELRQCRIAKVETPTKGVYVYGIKKRTNDKKQTTKNKESKQAR